jgi:hypothetical protein
MRKESASPETPSDRSERFLSPNRFLCTHTQAGTRHYHHHACHTGGDAHDDDDDYGRQQQQQRWDVF